MGSISLIQNLETRDELRIEMFGNGIDCGRGDFVAYLKNSRISVCTYVCIHRMFGISKSRFGLAVGWKGIRWIDAWERVRG